MNEETKMLIQKYVVAKTSSQTKMYIKTCLEKCQSIFTVKSDHQQSAKAFNSAKAFASEFLKMAKGLSQKNGAYRMFLLLALLTQEVKKVGNDPLRWLQAAFGRELFRLVKSAVAPPQHGKYPLKPSEVNYVKRFLSMWLTDKTYSTSTLKNCLQHVEHCAQALGKKTDQTAVRGNGHAQPASGVGVVQERGAGGNQATPQEKEIRQFVEHRRVIQKKRRIELSWVPVGQQAPHPDDPMFRPSSRNPEFDRFWNQRYMKDLPEWEKPVWFPKVLTEYCDLDPACSRGRSSPRTYGERSHYDDHLWREIKKKKRRKTSSPTPSSNIWSPNRPMSGSSNQSTPQHMYYPVPKPPRNYPPPAKAPVSSDMSMDSESPRDNAPKTMPNRRPTSTPDRSGSTSAPGRDHTPSRTSTPKRRTYFNKSSSDTNSRACEEKATPESKVREPMEIDKVVLSPKNLAPTIKPPNKVLTMPNRPPPGKRKSRYDLGPPPPNAVIEDSSSPKENRLSKPAQSPAVPPRAAASHGARKESNPPSSSERESSRGPAKRRKLSQVEAKKEDPEPPLKSTSGSDERVVASSTESSSETTCFPLLGRDKKWSAKPRGSGQQSGTPQVYKKPPSSGLILDAELGQARPPIVKSTCPPHVPPQPQFVQPPPPPGPGPPMGRGSVGAAQPVMMFHPGAPGPPPMGGPQMPLQVSVRSFPFLSRDGPTTTLQFSRGPGGPPTFYGPRGSAYAFFPQPPYGHPYQHMPPHPPILSHDSMCHDFGVPKNGRRRALVTKLLDYSAQRNAKK